MRTALLVSLAMHGALVVAMIASWPAPAPPADIDRVILVELVPVAEHRVLPDRLIAESRPVAETAPAETPAPVAAADPVTTPPPPSQASQEPSVPNPTPPNPAQPESPAPLPKPLAQPKPPPPEAPPEPEPEPRPEPEPEPVENDAPEPDHDPLAVAALLQDVRRPKTKPKPPARDFASVLEDVAAKPVIESEPESPPDQAPQNPAIDPLEAALAADTDPSDADAQLSMLEIDAIRKQISDNWDLPAGAKDAQNMVVTLRIQLNPDGTVTNVEVVDGGRLNSDPFYRAMAESAQRAVYRVGQIRNLRPASYATWRDMTINFDPREMFK